MVESGAMIVDLATLTAFVTLALTSRRFWPLWVAGLQLTASTAHALKLVDASLVPFAYAAAETLLELSDSADYRARRIPCTSPRAPRGGSLRRLIWRSRA